MGKTRIQFAVVLSAVLLACCFPKTFAQTETATVAGRVTDPSGSLVPNAALRLVDIDKNTETDTRTNKSGIYTFPSVQPGRYRIEVEHEGFKVSNITGLTVNVQDNLEENFRLEIGSQSESVTVDGSGLTLNTTDASVSTVVDRKFVANMPLNGRSFQDLISMTPGVTTQSPQSGSSKLSNGDFSINGQRTESNYYTVDGVAANTSAGSGSGTPSTATSGSVPNGTALGTTQSLVSVDALQEFRVESSTYSAEYGRAPGGQISFLTRSGTNTVHGTAFDYLRNNFFDANDWFNDHLGKTIAPLRQNDFGGTFGGPIVFPKIYRGINKSFFFFSYEGLRLMQPQATTIQYVPDTSMRQNSVAAMQPILNAFPIQNGPEALVACTQGATSTYPCPTGVATGTLIQSGLADFIESYSLPSSIDSTSIRLDHTFNSRFSVFFRFAVTPSSSQSRVLSALGTTSANSRTYTAGSTLQIADHLNNEFRYGYSTSASTNANTLTSFGGATPINLAAAMAQGAPETTLPLTELAFSGVGTSYIQAGRTSMTLSQWNLVDSVSWTKSSHNFKFGIDYRNIRSPLIPYAPLIEAILESPSSVSTGVPTVTEATVGEMAIPIFREFAAYGQDSWRISPSFTLSYGLRWEVNPAPIGADGKDAYTIAGDLANPSSLSIAPRGTPLWNTTWFNFAPRVGAAWQAHRSPGWETVARFGGGVFFDTDDQDGAQAFAGFGFSGTQLYSNVALPLTASQISISPSVSAPYSQLHIYPQHLQLPYSFQWNTSLEQALGSNQSITISYVGANGRRQIGEAEFPGPNSNFSTVAEYRGGLSSSYNALQIKFQRAVAHGVQALASYTWAHSIDEASTYLTFLPVQRGSSDFDVRNNFSAGASWDIPSAKQNVLSRAITNGWAMDGRFIGRTAFPVTLQGSLITDPLTGTLHYGGVNLISGEPLYLYGNQYPGGRAVNKAAFNAPVGTTVGNAPRNLVRGFGETQFNLAVRREFALYEALKLQFRAEAFNLFNHPTFGYVDPALTDATFGQATKMLDQSLGTVAPQYQQGGPRSMQFALKLQF